MNPVEQVFQYFGYSHLPEHLQKLSKPCHDLAETMTELCPTNPELAVGLRKLLEAKDCFVRSILDKDNK